MNQIILTDIEMRCIHLIARYFEENKDLVRDEVLKELQIDEKQYEVLMRQINNYGVIDNAGESNMGFALHFTPNAHAQQMSRQLYAEQQKIEAPPDIVEQIMKRCRSKPVLAGIIIVLLILAFLIPMVNGIFDLMEKLGLWNFHSTS